jgi:hypothetical protein
MSEFADFKTMPSASLSKGYEIGWIGQNTLTQLGRTKLDLPTEMARIIAGDTSICSGEFASYSIVHPVTVEARRLVITCKEAKPWTTYYTLVPLDKDLFVIATASPDSSDADRGDRRVLNAIVHFSDSKEN